MFCQLYWKNSMHVQLDLSTENSLFSVFMEFPITFNYYIWCNVCWIWYLSSKKKFRNSCTLVRTNIRIKDFVALSLTCHITVDGEMYLNLSTKVHHSYLKKSLLENVLCYMIFNVSYHESTSLHKKSFDCASVKKIQIY